MPEVPEHVLREFSESLDAEANAWSAALEKEMHADNSPVPFAESAPLVRYADPLEAPARANRNQPELYAEDYPLIPYHHELTVSEILDRIRMLGPGNDSRAYITYLRRLLASNPQLRKEMSGQDLAFVRAMTRNSEDF